MGGHPLQATPIDALIDDRPGDGVYRVHRDAFTDPDVFELEMRHVFEGGWVFLGMAAQAPQPHDYFTTTIGRVPVVVMRDGAGRLGAFVNSCPHRGAVICPMQSGNARLHVCPYHSWSFDSAGRNKAIKWKAAGAYPAGFDEASHDLAALPAFGERAGFLFGSLVRDVVSLDDHLREAGKMLDLAASASEAGLELVPGMVRYTYRANWKLQLENCSDAYHFTSVHPSYLGILARRQREPDATAPKSFWDNDQPWAEDARGVQGGSMRFANGHVLNWGKLAASDAHPLWDRYDQLGERLGGGARDWLFNMRNLTIFPNMQIAENASSQLRVIQPLAPGLTEMRTWCFAPAGEAAAARAQRIRQYEDFFNPSGMATPDDTIAYEACQTGYAGAVEPWLQGYQRGMAARRQGGSEFADAIGLAPDYSVLADGQLCDESLFQGYYAAWADRIRRGMARA